jgi:hemolysin III
MLEEWANAATHGLGFLLSLAGLVFLLAFAWERASTLHLVSALVYGTSLVALYGASTVYHLEPRVRRKYHLRMFDHIGIYFLIAGTYTPFTLLVLDGALRWAMFAAVWAIALAGTCLKLFHSHRPTRLSTWSYLLMGWLSLLILIPLWKGLPAEGFWLLVAGGAAYTAGTWFFARDHRRFHHAIWHLFVLAGSILHFCSIYFFALRLY